jgi:hypothetical protein
MKKIAIKLQAISLRRLGIRTAASVSLMGDAPRQTSGRIDDNN